MSLTNNLQSGDVIFNKEDLFTKWNERIPQGTRFIIRAVEKDFYIIEHPDKSHIWTTISRDAKHFQTENQHSMV